MNYAVRERSNELYGTGRSILQAFVRKVENNEER